MNTPNQINNTTVKTNSKILWYGMQASIPMLIILIYVMDNFVHLGPILPYLETVFIGLSLVSIATPFILLSYFKRVQHQIADNIQLGMDNESTDLHRYITFLILGMSLCSLPAMFGLILYILADNLNSALFFIGVSFVLGFLYKPDLK
jgi:hypothetical protein